MIKTEFDKIDFGELIKEFSITSHKDNFQTYLKDIWKVYDL